MKTTELIKFYEQGIDEIQNSYYSNEKDNDGLEL